MRMPTFVRSLVWLNSGSKPRPPPPPPPPPHLPTQSTEIISPLDQPHYTTITPWTVQCATDTYTNIHTHTQATSKNQFSFENSYEERHWTNINTITIISFRKSVTAHTVYTTHQQCPAQLCIRKLCGQTQAFIWQLLPRPLVPCEQHGHLKGCDFQIIPAYIIGESYLVTEERNDSGQYSTICKVLFTC